MITRCPQVADLTDGACGTTTIASAGDQGSKSDLQAVETSDGVALTCWIDDSNADVYFGKTTTQGGLWSTGLVSATGTLANGCGIDGIDANNLYVAYSDDSTTPDTLLFSKSTNGGLTWVESTIEQTVNPATDGPYQVAAKDANTIVVGYPDGSSLFRFCKTTNGGTNWACGSTTFSIVGGFRLTYDHDNSRFVGARGTTTETAFLRSDDDGSSWASSTVISGTSIRGGSLDYSRTIPDTYYFAWGDCDGSPEPNYYGTSEDGGITWTTEVAQPSSPDTVTVCYPSSGVSIATDGTVFTMASGAGNAGTALRFYASTASVEAPDTISPDATIAVTSLSSFDVDREGTVIIARTNSGDFVRTIESKDTDGSLDQLGSKDTGCVINDGVMASDEVVAFLDCVGGEPEPEFLLIRGFDLNQPNLDCDTSDECLTDIELDLDLADDCEPIEEGFSDHNDMRQVDDLQEFPLTYTVTREATIGDDQLAVAWAYAASSHYIGVAQYTTRIGCNDYATDRDLFGAAEPNQICSWSTDETETGGNLTGSFIGGVEFSSNTKFYEYTPSINSDGNLDGSLSVPTTYTGLGQGVGIACATDYAIIMRGTAVNNIVLLDTFSGETVWQKTIATTTNKGVAISVDGQFVAYYDGSVVNIAYRFNGTVFGTATPPSGTFAGIELDFNGQNLWIATDDNIAWYNLEQSFPEIPGGCAGFTCVPGVTPTPGATSTTFFGFTGTAGNAFLGLVLILVVMAITFTFFAQVGVGIAAVVSVVMGIVMFFVNVISGLFTTLLAFGTLFVIGAIVIFFKTR